MNKRWVKVAIAAVAAIVVILIVVPFFINADTFRPTIQADLSSALGRQVTLGHISLSLITGSLVADDISIADDPKFSTNPFLQAKKLGIGVELVPLLFSHSVQITDLTIDSPSINLIHAANGTWNFSSLGGATKSAPSQPSGPMPSFSVDKLKIDGGSAVLSSLPAAGTPLQCTDIDLTAKQISFTNQFPFELSLKISGGGSLSLKGTAGPVAPTDASLTPFDATLEIKHFDPVASGAVQPSVGIGMIADLNLHVASKDGSLAATGSASASQLKLARNGKPTANPVDLSFNVSDNLTSRAGRVNDLAIKTGGVAAHIAGTFEQKGEEPVLNLHLSAPNLPVDQVEQLLPAAGVTLPSGSRLEGGTINASLAITGPANAIVIAGPVELDNSKLSGFDLGGKIQGINPLGGTGGGTEIQKVSADVNQSPQGTRFTNIDAEVPKIGSATGEGTVSPTEDLNFQLTATISALSGVSTAVSNQVSNAIGGFFGNSSNSASNSKTGGGGIPLTVTGTASNPSIHADMGKMLKSAASGILGNKSGTQNQSPAKTLKGLFGR
jgi:AsmA protein